MAEAAGLAVGAVSLASLFSACIECMNYVSRARNYGKDFKNAMTKFDLLEARLIAWGKLLCVDQPGNELEALRNRWGQEQEIVGKALNRIKDIFDDRQELEKKYGLHEEKEDNVVQGESLSGAMASVHVASVDLEPLPSTKSRQQGARFWKKTVWAVQDSKKFDTLVNDLDFYIRNLEKITKRLPHRSIDKSGNERTLLDLQDDRGSNYAPGANAKIQYAYASLRPVAKYVSRPTLENIIRNQLSSRTGSDSDDGRIVVVWGLGGSGKSQLMLNYIKKYRQDYGAVIWIEAGEKEAIERDFIRLHRVLFPDAARSESSASLTLDNAVLGIKGWFHRQTKRRSLLVIDSADSIDNEEDPSYIDLNYFLPDAPKVDIVITTRSSKAQAMSSLEVVEVGQLTENEAVELFNRYAKLHSEDLRIKEEIVKIVQELGHLALAVTLAGSYVAATPRLASNISLYLPEYQKHRKRLLSRKATPNLHSYKQSVLSTWEASFEAIERQFPVAANLLCLLAFLNFDDIFGGLFPLDCGSKGSDGSDGPDNISHSEKTNESEDMSDCKVKSDSQDIFDSVNSSTGEKVTGIEESSNIKNNTQSQEMPISMKISETPSVEESPCEWQTLVSPQTKLDEYTIQEGFEMLLNYSLISWREDQEAYTIHKLVHTWSYDRLESKERKRWSLAALQLLSDALYCWKDLPVIERVRYVPHVVANFTLISVNPDTFDDFKQRHFMDVVAMGMLMKRAGKLDFAFRLRRYVAPFAEKALGAEDPITHCVNSQLAESLSDEGKYEEAEALQRQALRAEERKVDGFPTDKFQARSFLAMTLMHLDRVEEAKDLSIQNLEERKNLFQDEHIEVINGKLELAMILSCVGQPEDAERLFSEVLQVGRRSDMPDEQLHMCKSNFAMLLVWEDRFDEAEELFREVVNEQENTCGEDHPETLKNKKTLADVLYQTRKFEDAEGFYRQILEVRTRENEKDHPDILESKHHLADILYSTGRFEDAEELYRQILEVRTKENGKEHHSTLITMYDLAFACRDQEKHQEAVEFAENCWRSRKEILGAEHEDTIDAAELLESCQKGLQKSNRKFKLSRVKKLLKVLRKRK